MGDMQDLERRVAVVEGVLGLENPPPLDRLSVMDHRRDLLKAMIQQQGLSIGELARTVNRIETVQLEHGRKIDELTVGQQELRAGQKTIIGMLTTLIGGSGGSPS